jgi:fructose-bisphosphate aldolase class II
MPGAHTAELMAAAAGRGHGLAAFNVITLEHAEAIVDGAERAGAPVILQVSQNAVMFHGGRLGPLAGALRVVAAEAGVPVALHLDHVTSTELLHLAPGSGFSSVMVDASTLPYEDNVAATAAGAAFGHAHGLYVESELGEVAGKDGRVLSPHAPGARTEPAQAAAFVARTGVDALAVAVGSSHAMTTRDAALDHDLIAALRSAVPVPLVLHGSSGVPDDELRRAVAGGIVKVNIGTALNMAYTGAVRGVLDRDPSIVDPRTYAAEGREAMAAAVAHFVDLLTREENPVGVDRPAGRR